MAYAHKAPHVGAPKVKMDHIHGTSDPTDQFANRKDGTGNQEPEKGSPLRGPAGNKKGSSSQT